MVKMENARSMTDMILTSTHTVWAYMTNNLSMNKDHKSSSCSNIIKSV